MVKASLTRAVLVVACSALAVAGCGNDDGNPSATITAAELRTDVEPIVGLLPPLGSDFTVEWFGNTSSDHFVPGPSTYWVDALVTPTDGVDGLIGDHTLSPSTPAVGEQLTPLLPDCAWEEGSDINRAWGPLDWETHVWFCREHDQVVISMIRGD